MSDLSDKEKQNIFDSAIELGALKRKLSATLLAESLSIDKSIAQEVISDMELLGLLGAMDRDGTHPILYMDGIKNTPDDEIDIIGEQHTTKSYSVFLLLIGVASFFVSLYLAWGSLAAVVLVILFSLVYFLGWGSSIEKRKYGLKKGSWFLDLAFLLGMLIVLSTGLGWMNSITPLWGERYYQNKEYERVIKEVNDQKVNAILNARLAVKKVLKDPHSANFRNEYIGKSTRLIYACGEVNSKNSFGSYNGYMRYVHNGSSLYIEEGNPDFNQVWKKYC